jgi:pimeloyl-ACP methyl ester carboxylesterase
VSETHHSVPVEAGRAPVPAGELYYELAGSGDAVVLIHGNAGDLRHWDAQFESLADEYQVLRYDLRGFGRSSAPVPGEAFSAFGDLAALLTFLDIPRAHIVGWSVGAGVAADFALAYPEMTRSMVQVAPWVNGYSSDAANQLGVEMSAVFRAGREGGTAEAVDAWVNAPFWMATVRLRLAIGSDTSPRHSRGWRRRLHSCGRGSTRPRWTGSGTSHSPFCW